MKIHHLNCGTMLLPTAHLVCHVLLIETAGWSSSTPASAWTTSRIPSGESGRRAGS